MIFEHQHGRYASVEHLRKELNDVRAFTFAHANKVRMLCQDLKRRMNAMERREMARHDAFMKVWGVDE